MKPDGIDIFQNFQWRLYCKMILLGCPGAETLQFHLFIHRNGEVLMIGYIPIGSFRFIKVDAFYNKIFFTKDFPDNLFKIFSKIRSLMSGISFKNCLIAKRSSDFLKFSLDISMLLRTLIISSTSSSENTVLITEKPYLSIWLLYSSKFFYTHCCFKLYLTVQLIVLPILIRQMSPVYFLKHWSYFFPYHRSDQLVKLRQFPPVEFRT